MSEVRSAIDWFERAISETDEMVSDCSELLRKELLGQKQHFKVALDALQEKAGPFQLTMDKSKIAEAIKEMVRLDRMCEQQMKNGPVGVAIGYDAWVDKQAIYQMVADALREKLEREDQPKILTLDELRKMDGQPVWVEDLLIPKCSGWHFMQRFGETILILEPKFYPTTDGMVPHYDTLDVTENYGKTWVAYDRQPGGETNDKA